MVCVCAPLELKGSDFNFSGVELPKENSFFPSQAVFFEYCKLADLDDKWIFVFRRFSDNSDVYLRWRTHITFKYITSCLRKNVCLESDTSNFTILKFFFLNGDKQGNSLKEPCKLKNNNLCLN